MSIDHLQPDETQQATIEAALQAKYPMTLDALAVQLQTTPLQAARLLPADVCSFVQGQASERFTEVWERLCAWERVTLFIVHLGHVFEVHTQLSAGKAAQGYYNILHGSAAVGGHLRYGDIAAIAYLSMPFMQRASHCVVFFNTNEEVAFSVYVGRDKHVLIPSVLEAFEADKNRFCKE